MLIQSAALALDDSILDADQVENLLKFCPTKEEMELLKVYIVKLMKTLLLVIAFFFLIKIFCFVLFGLFCKSII